jgi:hypothetical protein
VQDALFLVGGAEAGLIDAPARRANTAWSRRR